MSYADITHFLQGDVFAAEQLLRNPDWAAVLSDLLERLGMTAEIDYIFLSERDIDWKEEASRRA